MKLSFKWNMKRVNSKALKIVSDLEWYVKKVSNMLLYDIRTNNIEVNTNNSINIISTPIYTKYRKENM